MNIHKKRELGNIGEKLAKEYLIKKGYEIIKNNYYCKQGEIDIICKKDGYLVFVEVKTRVGTSFGKPAEAINFNKKNHLLKSAKHYLYKNKLESEFIRFDVVEVLISEGKFLVNLIEQII